MKAQWWVGTPTAINRVTIRHVTLHLQWRSRFWRNLHLSSSLDIRPWRAMSCSTSNKSNRVTRLLRSQVRCLFSPQRLWVRFIRSSERCRIRWISQIRINWYLTSALGSLVDPPQAVVSMTTRGMVRMQAPRCSINITNAALLSHSAMISIPWAWIANYSNFLIKINPWIPLVNRKLDLDLHNKISACNTRSTTVAPLGSMGRPVTRAMLDLCRAPVSSNLLRIASKSLTVEEEALHLVKVRSSICLPPVHVYKRR